VHRRRGGHRRRTAPRAVAIRAQPVDDGPHCLALSAAASGRCSRPQQPHRPIAGGRTRSARAGAMFAQRRRSIRSSIASGPTHVRIAPQDPWSCSMTPPEARAGGAGWCRPPPRARPVSTHADGDELARGPIGPSARTTASVACERGARSEPNARRTLNGGSSHATARSGGGHSGPMGARDQLVTVSGAVAYPGVLEVAGGTTLAACSRLQEVSSNSSRDSCSEAMRGRGWDLTRWSCGSTRRRARPWRRARARHRVRPPAIGLCGC